jgi:hypothetical protein
VIAGAVNIRRELLAKRERRGIEGHKNIQYQCLKIVF